MSRSPLSYPLNRAADTDVGGAADLQTDIMRFMAILSLCLVAIFALVQSIPMAPVEPRPEPEEASLPPAEPAGGGLPAAEPARRGFPATNSTSPANPIVLTRPKWVPKYPKPDAGSEAAATLDTGIVDPVAVEIDPVDPEPPVAAQPQPTQTPPLSEAPPTAEEEGFTLRFASDSALTRAVAAHQVGVYALESGRAKRMTVSESRISFWDASTPNSFHEMEAHTVPVAVIRALERTGVKTGSVNWGVTLPGSMTSQLETLMREHRGGSLIIDASGDIRWEAS